MTKIKSYPVGAGNHNNIHYILRTDFFVFKLCAFPDDNKIFIMSSTSKIDKNLIDKEYLLHIMRDNLLNWDLTLIAKSSELFDLRFENTAHLLQSEYYKNA